MTTTNQTFETLSADQLAPVSGGGMISTIAGMFGPKGKQFGSIAENLFSMFKGGGSSGGGSSGGGSSGGGSSGGGLSSILGSLGGLGKLFGGGGSSAGGGGGGGGGSPAPADAGGGSGGE